MRNFLAKCGVLFLIVIALLGVGCASIVAKGQTYQEMTDSGALKWTVTEVAREDGGKTVWIPHWREGALHLSTPKATNAEEIDVLTFNKSGVLTDVDELGKQRERLATSLFFAHSPILERAHGKAELDIVYDAIVNNTVQIGTPLEGVLFAQGFPILSPDKNPRVHRTRNEISPTKDTLYYFSSRFGSTVAVEIEDNKVVDIHDGKHLSRDWILYPGGPNEPPR